MLSISELIIYCFICNLLSVSCISKFLDSLFLLQGANKQLSMLFRHNITIQALHYHLALIGNMNYTVLAIIKSNVLANLGIAIFILLEQGTEAAPAA